MLSLKLSSMITTSVIIVGHSIWKRFSKMTPRQTFFEVWWPAFSFVKPGTFVLKEDYAVLVQATVAAKPWELIWNPEVMTSYDKRHQVLGRQKIQGTDSLTPIPIVSIGAVASSS